MVIYLQIGSFLRRPHLPKDLVAIASRGSLLSDRPLVALGEQGLPGMCGSSPLRRRLSCSLSSALSSCRLRSRGEVERDGIEYEYNSRAIAALRCVLPSTAQTRSPAKQDFAGDLQSAREGFCRRWISRALRRRSSRAPRQLI